MKIKYLLLIFFLLIGCSSEKTATGKIDKNHDTTQSNSNQCIIKGKIYYLGKPMENAYALISQDKDFSGKGIAYKTSEPTDQEGNFNIPIEQGKFYIFAKKKLDNSIIGPLLIGDYFGTYDKNPQEIKLKKNIDIGAIELKLITSYGENILDAPKNTGITGIVQMPNNESLENIFIYVYEDDYTNLLGPSFLTSSLVDKSGKFTINLPTGDYFIVARKRTSGQKTGALAQGDYNVIYQMNPVKILLGKLTELNKMILKKIDGKKLAMNLDNGFSKDKDTRIEGIIVDEKNIPQKGMYTFVYKEAQMVGKPVYISSQTKEDGKFILYLKPDTYYLGARSNHSGPVSLDELVGSFDDNPDHLIKIKEGQILKNLKITAKKWELTDER